VGWAEAVPGNVSRLRCGTANKRRVRELVPEKAAPWGIETVFAALEGQAIKAACTPEGGGKERPRIDHYVRYRIEHWPRGQV
jgi:hypothetical protein